MKHTIILCAALLLCAALFSCGRPETVMPAEKPSAGVTAPSAGSSEPGKLAFSAQIIRTDGYRDGVDYPVVTVIDTADDLARYVDDNKDLYDFSHKETVYSDTTIGLVDAIVKYDAAWFADHRLLVVLLEEGSGSIRRSTSRCSARSAAPTTWPSGTSSSSWTGRPICPAKSPCGSRPRMFESPHRKRSRAAPFSRPRGHITFTQISRSF